MRGATAVSVCIVALALSACGSTRTAAPALRSAGLLTFVRGAPSTGLGVENTDLYSVTPDGAVRDLTSTPDAESDAVWSADGSRVVFIRRGTTGTQNGDVHFTRAGVFVWSPGHGSPRRVASCAPEWCSDSEFTWSPDGRRLAFVAVAPPTEKTAGPWGPTESAVEVMNADGSGTHVLCRSEKCGPGMGNLSWSPDGKQILFDTSRYHNGLAWNASTIWVAGATGSHVRQLTQRRCGGCMIDEAPSWSPDGKLIAFGREIFGGHETTGIEVMRADGTHLHRIYSCELGGNACVGEIVAPTWAPDGKAIAYTPAAVRSSGIRLTTLAGKTSTIRTCTGSHCVDAYDFVWSPNGRKLAFLGGDAIWVIGRNGKGMRRIARNAGCCIAWVNVSSLGGRPAPQPAQTPAPKLSGTIAFGLERGNDPDKLEVLGLGSPKAQPRALATSEIGIPSQGAWSPDGSKIAYSAARGFSNSSIYVANRDGTGVRLLVPSGFHLDGATEPAWSPDGRRIAFSIEGAKIGIVPAAGGPVRILTKNGTSPSWSPDGREIVFNRELGPGYALFTIHPDGSGLHRLTKLIGEQGPAVWSPDGKEIAFVWTASWSLQWFSVYLIHPDGTHLRRVSTASVGDGTPAWSADGRYLLLLSGLGDRSTLDVVDVRSGQVSRLRTLPGDAWGLSWSPR